MVVALTTWPHAELERLAPLTAYADVGCIESNADGTMKQVTLLAWVPVAPSVMRDVIVQTERYREFVPNVSKSTREPLGDGRWQSRWKIELPVSSFEGAIRRVEAPQNTTYCCRRLDSRTSPGDSA